VETGIILHSFVDTSKWHAAAPTVLVGPFSCSSPSRQTSETLWEFRAYQVVGLSTACHPDSLGLPLKGPSNPKSQLNTTASNIQEQETKQPRHSAYPVPKCANHTCTCNTYAIKDCVKRAGCTGKEVRTCTGMSHRLRWCAREHLQEKAEKEVKTERGKQIALHYHIL